MRQNLFELKLGKQLYIVYSLRNELHIFSSGQDFKFEEKYQLRFMTNIISSYVIQLQSTNETITIKNQIYFSNLLLIIDEDLNWIILGTKFMIKKEEELQLQENIKEVFSSQEGTFANVLTSQIENDQEKMNVTITQFQFSNNLNLILNTSYSKSFFFFQFKNIKNTYTLEILETKANHCYPFIYENPLVIGSKLIKYNGQQILFIIFQKSSVNKRKAFFDDELNFECEKTFISSFQIDETSLSLMTGEHLIENLQTSVRDIKFISNFLVIIGDETIHSYNILTGTCEILTQQHQIYGSFEVDNFPGFSSNHGVHKLIYDEKQKKVCILQIIEKQVDIITEIKFIQNQNFLVAKTNDQSLIQCQLIKTRIQGTRVMYSNDQFSLEMVKVASQIDPFYNIYCSKMITPYNHCFERINNFQIFQVQNIQQLEPKCLEYFLFEQINQMKNNIYCLSSQSLGKTRMYQFSKKDKIIAMENKASDFQFIDLDSYTINIIEGSYEYSSTINCNIQIQVCENKIQIFARNQQDKKSVSLMITFEEIFQIQDFTVDGGFFMNGHLIIWAHDQLHIFKLDFSVLFQNKKGVIQCQFIERFESEIEFVQVLNDYQFMLVKLFGQNQLKILQIDYEDALVRVQATYDLPPTTNQILDTIQFNDMHVNVISYTLTIVNFTCNTIPFLILVNNDLLQNKLKGSKDLRCELMQCNWNIFSEGQRVRFFLLGPEKEKFQFLATDGNNFYLVKFNKNIITQSDKILQNLKFSISKIQFQSSSPLALRQLVNVIQVSSNQIIIINGNNQQRLDLVYVTINPMEKQNKMKIPIMAKIHFFFELKLKRKYDHMAIIVEDQNKNYMIKVLDDMFNIVANYQLPCNFRCDQAFCSTTQGYVGCVSTNIYYFDQNPDNHTKFEVKQEVLTEVLIIDVDPDFTKDWQEEKIFIESFKNKIKSTRDLISKYEFQFKIDKIKNIFGDVFLAICPFKIIIFHICKDVLGILFIYQLDNEYFNLFRNEIPPQELDTLNFMKDFKTQSYFTNFLIIELDVSKYDIFQFEMIVVCDDNQILWLQGTSNEDQVLMKQQASIKLEEEVNDAFSYKNNCVYFRVNNFREIVKLMLITREENDQTFHDMIAQSIYHTNQQILYMNNLINFDTTHTWEDERREETVLIKKGGLLQIYNYENFDSQIYQGYL